MNKAHEFYPMLNRTIKNLIIISKRTPKDDSEIMDLLMSYPRQPFDNKIFTNPLVCMIKQELDRQYERWNKGYKNGNI